MTKKIFPSPIIDVVFKSSLINGPIEINNIFKRIIERVSNGEVKVSIDDLSCLRTNELGILSLSDIAEKVDNQIRLKDKTIIDLEANRVKGKEEIKEILNKSKSYVGGCVATFFGKSKNKRKYKGRIRVCLFNFNTFRSLTDPNLPYDSTIPIVLETNSKDDFIRIYNIYLPVCKKLALLDKDDIYNDLALFMCRSTKEMETFIKGNEDRKVYVEYIKQLERNKEMIGFISNTEYEKIKAGDKGEKRGVKKGYKIGEEKGLAKGLEQGKKLGVDEYKKEMIKDLYASDVSLEIISNTAKMPIEKIKKILNLSEEIEQ